jgi:hypothetical protein
LLVKTLIVNADDLGRTLGINAGIFAAHERGIVTSATLMVGFAAAVTAAAELSRYPRLSVGLHVTLTGAEPLLPPARIPSLVGPDGRFARNPAALGELDPAEVRAEVAAQLARFQQLTGRLPSHLDSHHHSHRHPTVCAALIEVARQHRLPVRRSSPAVTGWLAAAGVASTDAFEESFFGAEATLPRLLAILRELPPGTTELMCHPARVDDELRQGSTYTDDRERELEVLTSAEARAEVVRLGVRLVGF